MFTFYQLELDRIFQTLQSLKDRTTPTNDAVGSSSVASKIKAIHQVVMPGSWPMLTGTVNSPSNLIDGNQKNTSPPPKVLSPSKISNQRLLSNQTAKPSSPSSGSNSIKSNHSRESCNNSNASYNEDGISHRSSDNCSNEVKRSSIGMVNGRIVSRGSITSAGAAFVGGTLAASAASTEAATQLLSPNASVRRKNSKQKLTQSTTEGNENILELSHL